MVTTPSLLLRHWAGLPGLFFNWGAVLAGLPGGDSMSATTILVNLTSLPEATTTTTPLTSLLRGNNFVPLP